MGNESIGTRREQRRQREIATVDELQRAARRARQQAASARDLANQSEACADALTAACVRAENADDTNDAAKIAADGLVNTGGDSAAVLAADLAELARECFERAESLAVELDWRVSAIESRAMDPRHFAEELDTATIAAEAACCEADRLCKLSEAAHASHMGLDS